jgi:hypothetical protein
VGGIAFHITGTGVFDFSGTASFATSFYAKGAGLDISPSDEQATLSAALRRMD